MFPDKKTSLDILYDMYCARQFELMLERLFKAGELYGTTHLSVGQEGTAAGVIYALQTTDLLLSTHRGHAISLIKGADPNAMMAELFGRETGCCRGLGGSLHIVDTASGNYGANGIMAASLPIAAGIALSLKKDKQNRVIAAFFGDASANNGAFHEALNMAALWKLPVVFVCENNQYGMSTHISRHNSTGSVAGRAAAYGMPGVCVDGNDVAAVMQATREAAELARAGGGPSLLELMTYRWLGHSKSDTRNYRTREEEEEWMARCPIARFRVRMAEGGVSEAEMDEAKRRAIETIERAVAFARSSPALSFAEARSLVYSGGGVLRG